MKASIFLLSFISLFYFDLSAQNVEIKREREFTGAGLYGFMNGGADQFLEYGVSRLISRDLIYNGEEYTLDIYEMPTPEDAFGIYALHVFKCEESDQQGCINCLSPYQWQGISGNLYISAVFPSGTTDAKKEVSSLIQQYTNQDNEPFPLVPKALLELKPYSTRLKFLRGPIGLSEASLDLTQRLKDFEYEGIWFIGNKKERSYQAWIIFPDENTTQKVKALTPSDDLIESGANYLFLKGKEKTTEKENSSGFGF